MKYKYIVLFILFGSCNSSRDVTNQRTISSSTPKIIFLNYKILRNSEGIVEIKFINKTITNGKIKENLTKDFIPKKEDFKCIQMDNKRLSIDSIYISNPLYKVVEFINQSGQLGKKEIKLDSTEFTVRMQLNPKTRFIRIYHYYDLKKHLTEQKL